MSMLATLALSLAIGPGTGGELKSALKHLQSGEYDQALATLEMVDESSTDHYKARYLAGETLLLLGDAESAEMAFRAVVRDRPGSVPALVGLGRSLVRLGHVEEAEEHLEIALEEDENDAAAKRALAELYLGRGEIEAARELVDAVYAAGPENSANARALVEVLVRAAEGEEALKIARKLSKQARKRPMGPFLEGLALESLGRSDDAISAYEAALKRDETFLDAHKNLGILGHTLSNTYQIVERNALCMKHYTRYFELGGRDETLRQTYDTLRQLVEQGVISIG